jgi:hypothetical protein
MYPVATDGSAAAILEGYRRAMLPHMPVANIEPDTLTGIVERATEHAQGLAPRLPGIGERINRIA